MLKFEAFDIPPNSMQRHSMQLLSLSITDDQNLQKMNETRLGWPPIFYNSDKFHNSCDVYQWVSLTIKTESCKRWIESTWVTFPRPILGNSSLWIQNTLCTVQCTGEHTFELLFLFNIEHLKKAPSNIGPWFFQMTISSVRYLGPDFRQWCCVDFTYVTLVNQDTNLRLTDDANKAIPGNAAPPGDKICS